MRPVYYWVFPGREAESLCILGKTKIVYRDSIIFRDRIQTQTVEVEQQLTRWQAFMMRTGGATLTLLLLAIVTAALYLFLHFKNPFKL